MFFPWVLFEKLSKTGTIISQKVEDTVLQNDVASHANNKENAYWLATKMEALTGKKPEFIYTVTPVFITHVGIGSISLSVLVE